jgi:hypothetical protein
VVDVGNGVAAMSRADILAKVTDVLRDYGWMQDDHIEALAAVIADALAPHMAAAWDEGFEQERKRSLLMTPERLTEIQGWFTEWDGPVARSLVAELVTALHETQRRLRTTTVERDAAVKFERLAQADALRQAADEFGSLVRDADDENNPENHVRLWLRDRADKYDRTEADMTIQEFQAGCAHNFVNLSSFGDPYRRCQNCGLVEDRTEA